MTNAIADLVAAGWIDPWSGRSTPCPIATIAIEPTLDGAEPDLLRPLLPGRRLALVSDSNTHAVLGQRAARRLGGGAVVDEIVLPTPAADVVTAATIADRARHADALIAIGAGTINDLCKYVAATTGRPYAVLATAPSMNGYVTATASLAQAGLKRTLPAQSPRAVLLDLEVLARAPRRLIHAGIGDVLCRTTAQTDWLLGHCLRNDRYTDLPFLLQVADESRFLADTTAMAAGAPDAVAGLVRLLVLSGLGMLIAGGSEPASMGEHLVSHYVDMMAGGRHPASLHGEQIGVATLTLSRLQHLIVGAAAPPRVRATAIDDGALRRRYGAARAEMCLGAWRAKALTPEGAARLNRRLADHWPQLQQRLGEVMLPTTTLAAALEAAGAPTTAAALGLGSGFYRDAVHHAREIRNRYTVLDLAGDAGLLDDFVLRER